jgi:hypothetical protein
MDLMTVDLSDVPEAGIGSPACFGAKGFRSMTSPPRPAPSAMNALHSDCPRAVRTTEVGSVDVEL